MSAALETRNLTKRYGRRTALSDCTLTVPAGRVVGLVGPNGAGKSTLLQLACGLLTPSGGDIRVLGERPVSGSPRVAFVAQDTPVYPGFTVAEHLRLGAHLNPSWDSGYADRRIAALGLDPAQRAGSLSGGQRAQLALTVAAAKRPELLILDEPVAALDPLARRGFLQALMELAAESEVSVIMSSHLIADLERTCDHLIVLRGSRVGVAADVDDLLATHHRLTGRRRDPAAVSAGRVVIGERHTDVQSTLIVRSTAPIDDPEWQAGRLDLEDIVLAYLTEGQR
ncbi:ABC transporter ATP-binding protein [Actinoplanes lobatus]|uniref:ABC transporter ATP-binding protein n=1 Tax=Actinoplanes lobatus TaxID=113568 RepID=A0A7W7MHQ9_9ACTN|nr:ABC transporter ATP-binding protein [Actinoplanes lobatus]MBB4750782.1 ABC-2 type transport system ATP-binding protein [Actinoplanes lobatus]GGN68628.1 ABC transporter ATP-binding protein [Actinoplanes lobatus]GIE42225.1 ABC transporter ATP-binding protein [Actinoplanes lobatus]